MHAHTHFCSYFEKFSIGQAMKQPNNLKWPYQYVQPILDINSRKMTHRQNLFVSGTLTSKYF